MLSMGQGKIKKNLKIHWDKQNGNKPKFMESAKAV